LAPEAKFCKVCGASVPGITGAPSKEGGGDKPKRELHPWRGLTVALGLVLVMGAALVLDYIFAPQNQPLQAVLISGFSVTTVLLVIYIVGLLIVKTTINLVRFRRQPKSALITFTVLVALFLLIFLGIRATNDNWYKQAVADLPLIQDSLVQVEAQRILGYMINAKKAPAGTTMAKIKNAVSAAGQRISDLKVSYPLNDYQKVAVAYDNNVLAAASGTAKWSDLPDKPGDFRININQQQAHEILQASVKNIVSLKEFGDNAIQRKDRDAMRYIAAKLVVQQHWLNGIQHFANAGIWADKIITPVSANTDIYVPPVGAGCAVDLSTGGCKTGTSQPTMPPKAAPPTATQPPPVQQNSLDDEQLLILEQETIPSCERWGGTCTPEDYQKALEAQQKLDALEKAKQQQIQDQAKQNQIQNKTPQTPVAPVKNAVTPIQKETPKKPEPLEVPKTPEVPQTENPPNNENVSPAYRYDESERPQICLGAHAMGTYCAEDVIQSTQGIAASAIGFASGDDVSLDDWDNEFEDIEKALPEAGTTGTEPSVPSVEGGHEEGGLGVVSEDSPAAGAQLPKAAKAFSAECQGKGGYVGGANQDKGRLATTESGYHCNYKQGVNNCWDFLTYSGSRYMGGDVGCQELNLLPIAQTP
jgi:hypothetical protein